MQIIFRITLHYVLFTNNLNANVFLYTNLPFSKEPYNGSDWYVRTNIGRGDDAGLAQNHEVLRIVSHPHSSKFRSLILRDYDVALVRLKHALVFVSDKIGAICPPEEQVPAGITCFSGVLGTQKPRGLFMGFILFMKFTENYIFNFISKLKYPFFINISTLSKIASTIKI